MILRLESSSETFLEISTAAGRGQTTRKNDRQQSSDSSAPTYEIPPERMLTTERLLWSIVMT